MGWLRTISAGLIRASGKFRHRAWGDSPTVGPTVPGPASDGVLSDRERAFSPGLGRRKDVQSPWEVGGGAYAATTHDGPYETPPESIEALYLGLPASGREPRWEPLPFLYSHAGRDAKPSDRQTETCLPVRPLT